MSEGIAATLSADLRARSTFLPYCPICSHVGVTEFPDLLRGPSYRSFKGRHKLDPCCSLSDGCEWHDSQADCAAWWRKARLEPVKCMATNNRRISTLDKLERKGLEPITAADAQRDSHQDSVNPNQIHP